MPRIRNLLPSPLGPNSLNIHHEIYHVFIIITFTQNLSFCGHLPPLCEENNTQRFANYCLFASSGENSKTQQHTPTNYQEAPGDQITSGT